VTVDYTLKAASSHHLLLTIVLQQQLLSGNHHSHGSASRSRALQLCDSSYLSGVPAHWLVSHVGLARRLILDLYDDFSDNGVMGGLVNGVPFNKTFDTPDATMIGLIVAIYESESSSLPKKGSDYQYAHSLIQLAVSLALFALLSLASNLAGREVLQLAWRS
jgi:hypothetical protein